MDAIRELKADDIYPLVELVYIYKCSLVKDFSPDNKSRIRSAFENVLNKEASKCLVYESEKKRISGYLVFHIVDYPMICGKELYVSDLLIDEEYRGKGVGKSLLSKAEEYSHKNGCQRMMLNNPKESAGYKRSFYKKQGFTERLLFANFVKEMKLGHLEKLKFFKVPIEKAPK